MTDPTKPCADTETGNKQNKKGRICRAVMAVQEKGARSTGRKTEYEKSGWKRTTFGLDMLALLYRLTCVELEQWNPLGGSISHHSPFVLAQNEKNNHCSAIETLMSMWRTLLANEGRRSSRNTLGQCRPVFSCHAEAVHEVVGVHCRHFRDDLCSVTLTVTAFRPCAGTTS